METLITILYNLLDLLIIFIENYLIIKILNLFFVSKKNLTILATVIFSLIAIISTNIISSPVYSSVLLLFLLYIYTFANLEGSLKNKSIIPLLAYINLFIINVSISIIFSLMHIDFSEFLAITSPLYFAISYFQKFILLTEYIFIKKYFNFELYFSKNTWIFCLLLTITSIIFPIIYFTQFVDKIISNPTVLIFSLIQCLFINILIYIIITNLSKDHQKILENEILIDTKRHEEKLVNLIESKTSEIHKITHDLNHHKRVIEQMIKDNVNLEVNDYINDIFDVPLYIHTNNNVVNYILNDKIEKAKEKNIDVKCLIQGDLSNSISQVDISIVFGNLMDNAIEACSTIENKHISINIFQDDYKLIIDITNTYNGIIKKQNNGLIKTSKKSNSHHGYGLLNIKSICKKYDGNDYINYDNNKFQHICTFILNSSSKKD